MRIPGERGRDRNALVGIAAEILREKKPHAMFVDSAFGAPIVERLRTLGFKQVHEVNFGSPSPDMHQFNHRAYMWHWMKDWSLRGAIPNDENLHTQLTGPGYHINQAGKLVIESKKDMVAHGVASPDDADALALTFAHLLGLRHRSLASTRVFGHKITTINVAFLTAIRQDMTPEPPLEFVTFSCKWAFYTSQRRMKVLCGSSST